MVVASKASKPAQSESVWWQRPSLSDELEPWMSHREELPGAVLLYRRTFA